MGPGSRGAGKQADEAEDRKGGQQSAHDFCKVSHGDAGSELPDAKNRSPQTGSAAANFKGQAADRPNQQCRQYHSAADLIQTRGQQIQPVIMRVTHADKAGGDDRKFYRQQLAGRKPLGGTAKNKRAQGYAEARETGEHADSPGIRNTQNI